MRDPERIDEILELISDIWHKNPDLRLCQLLSNAAIRSSWPEKDLYYLEDDELIDMLLDEYLW